MQRTLFQEQSDYHLITVYETDNLDGEKGRFRVLQFASEANQGVIDLDKPERILFEYPRALIHLMEHNQPSFEQAFVIGHGIGTLPRYFADRQITVAELDPKVVELSRTYFGYGGNNVWIGDGRALLSCQQAGSLDYVVLDAFTAEGTPEHLISNEFFSLAAEKLTSKGAILLNVTGRAGNDHRLSAIAETMKQTFAYTRNFALKPDSMTEQVNFILTGSRHPLFYQARHMAGFTETVLPPGLIIYDL